MMTLLRNPNFLILDEPSNDFDINTLHVLEEFLLDFPGTLLIVSHDRFLLDKLADHLFVFEGNGVIKDFPGNYTQWKWAEEEKAELAAQEKQLENKKNALKPKEEEKPKTPAQKLSFKERQELENLETEIEKMEARKAEIGSILEAGSETDLSILNDLII